MIAIFDDSTIVSAFAVSCGYAVGAWNSGLVLHYFIERAFDFNRGCGIMNTTLLCRFCPTLYLKQLLQNND